MTKELYSLIEEWKDKKYYSDFSTLVDMAYELEYNCKKSNVEFNFSIEENIGSYFRALKFAQKDVQEGLFPAITPSEVITEAFATLISYERRLNYQHRHPDISLN